MAELEFADLNIEPVNTATLEDEPIEMITPIVQANAADDPEQNVTVNQKAETPVAEAEQRAGEPVAAPESKAEETETEAAKPIENTAVAETEQKVSEQAPAPENKAEEPKEETVDEADSRKKKEPFGVRFRKGIPQLLIYFGITAASIILWELVVRLQMGGGLKPINLFFLFFVPAEAMAVAAVNGFLPRKASRFVFPFMLLVIGVFYGIQMVYYRIFGSLLSVYLLGMGGDAVGNFGWAMKETIIKSIGLLVILFLPVIVTLVLCLFKKVKCEPYPVLLHIIALGLAVGFWFAASEGIILAGDGRQSAYYAFHSNISDTDTTASRVGTMTTTIVEAGSYYLGLGNTGEVSTLTSVDMDSISLEPEPISEKIIEKKETEIASDKAGAEKEEKEEVPKIPYVYEEIDFKALADNTTDQGLKDMYNFFAQRKPTTTNEYTGLMEGYNLIYICAESFWTYGIDERVTPTLYKMANNGIILNNYYNSFRNTTTNGEYAFITSLWPDVSRQADSGLDVGSLPQSSTKYMPNGLGDFFAKEDVPSYGFHNYYGNYYRRRYSWPNLGMENIYFMNEGMRFTSTWPASDMELMEQSVDKYIEEDRFFAYYMTFSGHGPYNTGNFMFRKNIKEVQERLGDDAANYSQEALGYFAGSLELEYGMEYLIDRLEEAGKLENTLIVLTGDHYPYYVSENGRNSLAGKPIDEMELYKSTCIMYTEGLEENIESDVYCCNVDIIPTVLNLFGMKFDSRLFMGTDIFSNGIHKAVLYNKSFITDKVIYDARNGNTTWKIDLDRYDWNNLNSYVDNMSALVDSEYSASVNVIKKNFYYHVWLDSGLMTEEEAAEERNREATVTNEMAAINAQEAQQREEYAAKKAAEDAALLEEMIRQGIITPDGQVVQPEGQAPAPAPEAQPQPVQ